MAEDTNATVIADLVHPFYKSRLRSWLKWRLCFEGGDDFINFYLKQFSKSEEKDGFHLRKEISYVPAFAKVALIEVRNSIYQRLCDITRAGGSKSWQDAVAGNEGGVDLLGSSMNTFMGTEVLEDLLVMGKVGVYVDMPPKRGMTLADNIGAHPYLYVYKTEDIRAWDEDESPQPFRYRAVLLRETIFVRDPVLNLPTDTTQRYRYYYKDDAGDVWVQFYDDKSQAISPDNILSVAGDEYKTGDPIKLGIRRIPFVVLELNNSLLADIANYQIALLNLASTDMAYATGANFPFYTEEYDPKEEASHLKTAVVTTLDPTTGGVIVQDATAVGGMREIPMGPTTGRRYAKGMNPPSFIHPSSEPMKASLQKQEQLKLDIRLLINLSIADIQPKFASAESKGMDSRTLESGLSYIGLILEDAEREIALIWHEYERSKETYKVKYPEKYSLKTTSDTFSEVDELKKQMSAIPSITFKRVLAKRIAELLIGHRITSAELQKIFNEIDNAKVIDILIDKIEKDVPLGYCSPQLAAEMRGYPPETIKEAQDAQTERLKQIAISQSTDGGAAAGLNNPGARGVGDLSANPKTDVTKEKDAAGNPVRGTA